MKTWLIFLFPILSLGLIMAESGPGQQQLISEEKLLESELTLAKASPAYVLINTGTGKTQLKARGMVLREWNIVGSGRWGFPFTTEPRQLLEKNALLSPRREEIKPGGGEAAGDSFELQALELSDMPESFAAILSNNIRIHVKSSPGGTGLVPRRAADSIRRLFLYPLRTIISSLRGEDFSVLELEFESGTEVQAFYWALQPDTSFLVSDQASPDLSGED